jgi:hypothetical protein
LHKPAVVFGSAYQTRRRLGRVEDRFGERALILDREADNLGFLDRAVRGFLRRRDDKVADAASLDLGGAFDDGERLGSDARFEPRRAGLVWSCVSVRSEPT